MVKGIVSLKNANLLFKREALFDYASRADTNEKKDENVHRFALRA